MKKKILLTRPRAASEKWAAALAQQGFDCVVEPLLTITPTHAPRPQGDYQAVIFTSTNAPDALAEQKEALADLLHLPCFCVGISTGAAARSFGFTDIHCGVADSAALAGLVVADLSDTTKPVLHICGDTVDEKVHDILARAGIPVALWTVYKAQAVKDFTPELKALFTADGFAMAPVFSPRSARILVSIIEKNHLVPHCFRITAVALSQAVADVLQTLPWKRLRVAASPREEEMLACMRMEVSMPETPTMETAAPVSSAKKKPSLRLVIGASLMAAGILAAFLSVMPETQNLFSSSSSPGHALVQVQNRLGELESKLDISAQALREITPKELMAEQGQQDKPQTAPASVPLVNAPPPVVVPAQAQAIVPQALLDDVAALKEQVKSLQAQLAAQEDKRGSERQMAQQWLSGAMAFWQLREAAAAGNGFAQPLAALAPALSGEDAALLVRLMPMAKDGAPTFAQLKTQLVEAQASIKTVDIASDTPAWYAKILPALRRLVSVRPLRDPAFAPLETALDARDGTAALAAFAGLAEAQRTALAAWGASLNARLTLDAAVAALNNRFLSPAAQEPKP